MMNVETIKDLDEEALIELVISLEKENKELKIQSETTCSNSEKLLLMSFDMLIDERIKKVNDMISSVSSDLHAYVDNAIKDHREEYHDYRGSEE